MTAALAIWIAVLVGAAAPEGLIRLAAAYPEQVACYEENALRFRDGARMIYDTGPGPEDFEDRLNAASLKDQMSIPYPAGPDFDIPAENEDPGRLRHTPFFEKIYGKTERQVRRTLAKVSWAPSGTALRVTTVNGVAERLASVGRELAALPKNLTAFVDSPAGVFNWRPVRGTHRLSPHSFGLAIDIDTDTSDYWRWQKEPGEPEYRNRIPMEIVKIFEAHGFIWGGKWYHYDTMHFEYRPELLPLPDGAMAKACED